jgi:hypothetical protein
MKKAALEATKSTIGGMMGSTATPIAGANTNNYTVAASVESMGNTIKLQEEMVTKKEKLTDLEKI